MTKTFPFGADCKCRGRFGESAVMKGYYKDAEATGEAMRGGWFHTGDAAAVHHDG